jgi:hypothetical protein
VNFNKTWNFFQARVIHAQPLQMWHLSIHEVFQETSGTNQSNKKKKQGPNILAFI